MSVRGGLGAGLLVMLIVLFCFSIRLGKRVEGQEHAAADEHPWHEELRVVCQPAQRPDPGLHRPPPPEHDDDPPALGSRGSSHREHLALTR